MFIEWFVWTDLAVDVFVAYAHLGVGEVVMSLEVEVVVGADLGVDVVVDMSFEVVEIAEGDPAVEPILEWEIQLGIVCAVRLFSLLALELFNELAHLSCGHGCCRRTSLEGR